MRKLKLQVQTSVDGFISGPNGEMGFLGRQWDAGLIQYVTAFTEPIDTIVLGHNLAKGFIPHWASVAADPQHPEHPAGVKFTNTPKVVFSKTLDQSQWENTVLAKGDVVDEINQLKNKPGQDIVAYGGATFVGSLVKNGLIDEYHLFVNPAAIGQGKSIFNQLTDTQNLTLVKASQFDCGIVVLHYEPKRA